VLSLIAESSLDPFRFKKFDFDATLAWNEKGKGTTGASEFMYDELGIRSLVVAIKVDSEAKDSKAADSKTTDSKMVVSNGAAAKVIDSPAADSNSVTMSLSGEAIVTKKLVSVGDFKVTLTKAGLEFAKNDSVYSAVISSQISLAGYDPSQRNEPDLLLNGSLAVSSEKKITLNVALDPTNSWINPFGLSGTKMSDLSLDIVGKLSPASLTVDFDATLVWDSSIKPKAKSASEFLNDLGVKSIFVHIGLDTEKKSMSIKGTIDMQIQIIHAKVKDGYFSLTLTQTTVEMALTFSGTPDLAMTLLGKMELKGYDTSQLNEPTLTVTGAIKLSLTGMEIGVSFTTGATPWENPFGLKGFQITTLAVQIGATYVPPFLDSFGFVADVGFYSNSIIAGFYIKLSDPTIAFYIETKPGKPLDLVQLIDDTLSGFKDLQGVKNFVDMLFGKSHITIESVDGNHDGKLDPLILFSPKGEVKVVDQVIPGGMGLNAKLKIGGFSATLILNVSDDFKKIFAKISFSFAGDEYSAELGLNGTKVHLDLDSPLGHFKFDVDLAKFDFAKLGDIVWDYIKEQIFAVGDAIVEAVDDAADYIASGFVSKINKTGTDGNNTINGAANKDTLFGKGGNDTINGNGNNDSIDGGPGDDSLYGGDGKDVILGGTGDDKLSGGDGNDNLKGGDGDDTLYGGTGDDKLNGGSGVDRLEGGTGDDRYYVDDEKDVVKEDKSNGNDTVYATASTYTLSAYVENLIFTTTGDNSGTGNASDNQLTGNDGNDSLKGMAGDDTLDGGKGDDILTGGDGNDTLIGSAGEDTMNGGAGDDEYSVTDAKDVVIEAKSGGDDTIKTNLITYTLPVNVENLSFTGKNNNNGIGNELKNKITGNKGDDTLDGGLGADTLDGNAGNDYYIVDNEKEVIKEDKSGGKDTIETMLTTYTLSANVENLIFTETSNHNGTGNASDNQITGNNGNDSLTGMDGDDTLNGGDGNDTLMGNAGEDTMKGGAGDDSYLVTNAKDVVTEEKSNGNDTIQTTLATYTLGANVENLIFIENDNSKGTGNDLNNQITGNQGKNTLHGGKGADTLDGGDGKDTLDGGVGQDLMIGGKGADVFVVTLEKSGDVIQDFSKLEGDKIDLSAIDANTSKTFNQAFKFIGSEAFSAAGQLRFETTTSTLYGNVNADSTADFSIQLSGITSLTGADFVL